MIHHYRPRITHHDSQPLAQHSTPWCIATGSALHTMIHNYWLGITHIVSYYEPVVMNHGVLCWSSGCGSWCVMLSLRLWIMVCFDEPVVVNHGVLCWACGCESWCVMLSQWLWIMLCYAEPVVVNHYVLFWASCCATSSALHSMIHNHLASIAHHDSQPLAQHSTP
jgi:hypothetical protein